MEMECVCNKIRTQFLGTFAKLRKATISLCPSVRLYVRPYGTTRFPFDGF